MKINGKKYNNLYKETPFIKGNLYTKGEYVGRYDGWSYNFGSFMFKSNGTTKFIHPEDKKLKNIKIL